jgi:integrase/recombinase XerD
MADLRPWTPPIADAYAVFRLHCQARRLSPKTLEFDDWRIPRFIAWLATQGVGDLRSITANHIRAYLIAKQDDGAAPAYVHNIARALRAWLNFCAAEEWLASSPMAKVAMPRLPRKVLPALTPTEIKRLLRMAVTARDKAIVLVLLDTGLRASELLALVGADVEIATGSIQVRHGKGDKARTVYIGGGATRALLRYYAERGAPHPRGGIWLGERRPHRPLTYDGLKRIMSRLSRDANLPHLTAHALRRTYALTCLRNGMNLYALQRLMGHEDISILRQYLALVETDLAAASRQHGVVDNL